MDGMIVQGVEAPRTCSECPFRGDPELFSVAPNLFKYISRCLLAPEELEDPWRDIGWQLENKENFCPIINTEKIFLKGENNNA